jgi:hypothetical protein
MGLRFEQIAKHNPPPWPRGWYGVMRRRPTGSGRSLMDRLSPARRCAVMDRTLEPQQWLMWKPRVDQAPHTIDLLDG